MSPIRSALLSLLCALAALATVEGTTRLLSLAPKRTRFLAEFTAGREFVRPHPTMGFALVPGFSDGRYRINDLGFRGDAFPANLTSRFTILCAGDSTTFGWQVGEREHFPYLLARRLEQRLPGTSWVVNGGVPSFTSAQVVEKLAADLPLVEPEVVVLTMPWNDMWYSSFSPWSASVLVPRLPGGLRMRLIQRSAFFRLLAQPPVPKAELDRSADEALDAFQANLSTAVSATRKAGAIPVLQTPPFDLDHVAPGGLRFEPTGLHWDRDFVMQTALRYVSRLETLAEETETLIVSNPLSVQNPNQRELFIDEIHPTGEGYERTASALFEALEAAALLPE